MHQTLQIQMVARKNRVRTTLCWEATILYTLLLDGESTLEQPDPLIKSFGVVYIAVQPYQAPATSVELKSMSSRGNLLIVAFIQLYPESTRRYQRNFQDSARLD